MPEIAVICDPNGYTSTVFDGRSVRIYTKTPNGWLPKAEYPIEIDAEQGLSAVRGALERLIGQMAGAAVVAGRKMSGVAYHLFDAAGFAVFEMVGQPERYLDFIEQELQKETELLDTIKRKSAEVPESPQPTGQDGIYTVNLMDLQKYKPEISSKMALLPFLQNETFAEVQVVCAHIPPWFDRQLAGLGLWYEASRLDDGSYLVNIFHATCG